MGKQDDVIHVIVDPDWPGDRKTRCYTSGGVLAIGPCFAVRHWSVTQATVSLSSAESEAKAITKGCIALENVADMLTKHVPRAVLDKLTGMMGYTYLVGKTQKFQEYANINQNYWNRRTAAVERLPVFDDGENESLEVYCRFCFSWPSIHLFATFGKHMQFGFPFGGRTACSKCDVAHTDSPTQHTRCLIRTQRKARSTEEYFIIIIHRTITSSSAFPVSSRAFHPSLSVRVCVYVCACF